MYFGPFQRVNAANTGFLCPKVPIHRKLREDEKATRHGSLRRSQMGRVFYMRYVREGHQILQIKPGSWALLVMR